MALVLADGVGQMDFNLKGLEMICNLDSTQMLFALVGIVGIIFLFSFVYKYLKTKI